MVEFALVLPIFLALLLMAVDFGRLFFPYIQVSNAAREAAVYGATQPTDSVGMHVRAVQEKNSQTQHHRLRRLPADRMRGWQEHLERVAQAVGATTGSSPGEFASLAVQLVR